MIEGQENYLLVVDAQSYQLKMSVIVFHTYLEEFVWGEGYYHCWIGSLLCEIYFFRNYLNSCWLVILVCHAQDFYVEFV